MNYLDFIDDFTFEPFEDNDRVRVTDMHTGRKTSFSKTGSDPALIDFYNQMDGFRFAWNVTNDNPDDGGSIKILPAADSFIDGKDLVYFDHTPADSPLRDFYIVDFFVDEACVGVYRGRPELPGMHYFEFENASYPLHVDFAGYLRLAGAAKGFRYWQKAILDHLNPSRTVESAETTAFKTMMPQLFADFDYDAFVGLYESLRIDR